MPIYIYRGRYSTDAGAGGAGNGQCERGGSISNMKTTVAVTSKEAMAAFKMAAELAKTLKNAGR
jgi:hypothetical protein